MKSQLESNHLNNPVYRSKGKKKKKNCKRKKKKKKKTICESDEKHTRKNKKIKIQKRTSKS